MLLKNYWRGGGGEGGEPSQIYILGRYRTYINIRISISSQGGGAHSLLRSKLELFLLQDQVSTF